MSEDRVSEDRGTPERPVFTLHLRATKQATHKPQDPGGWRRLKALLKALLRRYDLQCLGIDIDPLPPLPKRPSEKSE